MPLARWLVAFALAAWSAGCASLPANVGRVETHAFATPEQTALGRLVQQRRSQDHAHAESAFHLLDNADEAFSARVALIDGAQQGLDLQYYAIHADNTTEVLLEHLRDAARRGVRVRVLLDDFNTVGTDAQVLRLAFEPNVQIRLFNPLPGSRASLIGRVITSLHDFDRLQKRMHNKMFIADSAMGITGGRNLGDAYFGGDGKSSFVDLEVLAAGKVVRDMSASFDRYWNDPLAYPMQTLVTPQQLEELRTPAPSQESEATHVPANAIPLPSATASSSVLPASTPTAVASIDDRPADLARMSLAWAPSLLLADQPGKIGPDDDEADAGETVVDGLLQLMQQARQDILIVSPYFVPGEQMMRAFAQLRSKGIHVRVLTNSLASNDALAAHAGYAHYRRRLLALGVELNEMRANPQGIDAHGGPGIGSGGGSKSGASRASLHSKVVVIDGRFCVIGSMNLDLRSQRKNSEVALLIRSRTISQLASRRIEETIGHAAYRLETAYGELVWRAPPGAPYKDAHNEPEASTKLRVLASVIAPFAPDEML